MVDRSYDIITIVILGATSDLAKRKLLPALANLACKGRPGVPAGPS